ncbi:serine/threonine protein kinase [Trichocoleus desertorum AS-A10]|uniref:serine/threonine-protein kinase n=1 Tax=Trichocoleus desertorum TaxID=1481672 RepID=UPI0032975909
MSYCINPKCPVRQNPDDIAACLACGTPLLIQQRYRLVNPLRELDEPSQAEIFAIDDQGKIKVMKVLKNPRLLKLFEREAKTLQQLKHSGIPQVELDGFFTVTIHDNPQILYCLVMQKIEGKNLEQWLEQQGPISEVLAWQWLKQLIEVLEKVHQHELFHRDIKLSNIMLQPQGQLALIDFGTVREVTNTYLAKVGSGREVTGIVSPGYTPLEQVNGKAVPQSDFYALGRSFVYLLTGKHPIDLPEDPQTGTLIWRNTAPQVSSRFADLIDDLMAPFPGQRPLNTQEILQRLTSSSLGRQKRLSLFKSRLQWLIIFNLCLFLLQLVTGLLWLQAQRQQTWGLNRDRPMQLPSQVQ